MKIAVSKIQLENLLDVLKSHQKCDVCRSEIIEIELVEESDIHLKADKLRFYSRSIYAECDSQFLGTN